MKTKDTETQKKSAGMAPLQRLVIWFFHTCLKMPNGRYVGWKFERTNSREWVILPMINCNTFKQKHGANYNGIGFLIGWIRRQYWITLNYR